MQKNRNKKEVFSAGYLYHTNFGTFEVFRQISRIYYGSLEIYYGIESNGVCLFLHSTSSICVLTASLFFWTNFELYAGILVLYTYMAIFEIFHW